MSRLSAAYIILNIFLYTYCYTRYIIHIVSLNMSCFGGKTNEYPTVSLDRFDGVNLDSTLYFLSHCHSDHMVGLADPAFSSRLSENGYKLYCHPVTAGLLIGMSWYEHLQPFIEKLPSDKPQLIQIPGDTRTISVTLIPAGHCPGSVMFLLEGDEGTVLYTGDFRYHLGETTQLSSLFSGHDNKPKYQLDSVYLDTTFFIENAKSIPSRQTCRDLIIKWAENWQKRSPSNIVHVFSRSNYGYEFLMVALSKYFKSKVHVTQDQYQRYRYIPSILSHLTTSSLETRIHFCKHVDRNADRHKMPCINNDNQLASSSIFQIVPSVMYFTRSRVTPEEMVVCENEKTVRVCYSSHSSYEEIVEFVTKLAPRKVYPNVKPNSDISLEDLREKMEFLIKKPRVTSTIHTRQHEKVTFRKKRQAIMATSTDEPADKKSHIKTICLEKPSEITETSRHSLILPDPLPTSRHSLIPDPFEMLDMLINTHEAPVEEKSSEILTETETSNETTSNNFMMDKPIPIRTASRHSFILPDPLEMLDMLINTHE